MPTKTADGFWADGRDDYGNPTEITHSDGDDNPCRHCLAAVHEGDAMLVLAYRPFGALQPYAETGPVFLHANPCRRYEGAGHVPPLYANRRMLIRGYNDAERIVYGTGQVVPANEIEAVANVLFADDRIAFLHARSPTNNCYHFRIERDGLK